MTWFRRGTASPTEADQALSEARAHRAHTEHRAKQLEPLLERLEQRRHHNFIAEAVEATLRKGDTS